MAVQKVVIISNLGRVMTAVNRALYKAADNAAKVIEKRAQEICPVDTGELKKSITHETKRQSAHTVQSATGPTKEYGVYVELGTGIHATNGNGRNTPWRYQDRNGDWHTTIGQRPQPYLRPAVEKHLQEIRNAITDAFKGL